MQCPQGSLYSYKTLKINAVQKLASIMKLVTVCAWEVSYAISALPHLTTQTYYDHQLYSIYTCTIV